MTQDEILAALDEIAETLGAYYDASTQLTNIIGHCITSGTLGDAMNTLEDRYLAAMSRLIGTDDQFLKEWCQECVFGEHRSMTLIEPIPDRSGGQLREIRDNVEMAAYLAAPIEEVAP